MKVKFTIHEMLYATEKFEINCNSQEEVDAALDEIGEYVSGEELLVALQDKFGRDNVSAEGVNGFDNIVPLDEYDFQGWDE